MKLNLSELEIAEVCDLPNNIVLCYYVETKSLVKGIDPKCWLISSSLG